MILPNTENRTSHAKPTYAVDIIAFVEAQEIPSLYFETPYHLTPAPGGEKAYALLRDALRRTQRIGIAHVVIRSRPHIAALVPEGQSLVLNTLRWNGEADPAERYGMPLEDMLAARELTLMEPPGSDGSKLGGWDLAWHREPYQPEFAALAEHSMKSKKSPEIVVEELEGLMEEDDCDIDDLLAVALSRRPHPATGDAARRQTRKAHRPAPLRPHARARRS